MGNEEVLKLLRKLDYGVVIKYRDKSAVDDTYLIVQETKDGRVCGQMASPLGVNSISLEELLKKDGLLIAEFKKLQ